MTIEQPSPTSSESTPTSSSNGPQALNPDQAVNIQQFRNTEQGRQVAAWVKSEYQKSRNARRQKQMQWVVNMSFVYGRQWLEKTSKLAPGGFDNRLFVPQRPGHARRLTVNKTRSFVRRELSKFISQAPSATVIPSTAEDQDVRAAYAGEQVWESYSSTAQLDREFSKAMLWMIYSGNGFMKTQWDDAAKDKISGHQGTICFGAVSPFNIFIPDLREQEIEDQPYAIHAYTRPVGWCKQYFADALQGVDLSPSTTAANEIIESGYLNLQGVQEPDSCTVYECWVKPGGNKYMPNGGIIIQVDDIIVGAVVDGMPYEHDEYPFTHFKHIDSGTFYADSPLVDTNQLQKEYNQLRSEISEAGRRMARPQLLAQQGSIVVSKMTNEPGSVIQYRPGTPPPQPIPLSPLPQYYVEQQEVIQSDWEDITGQHDASTGSTPAGLTAGTAINYLQEQDNSFLTPQYKSIELGYEKLARQTLQLFNQYVNMPRKVKTIGADGAFDVVMLAGSDIKSGLDIRIDPGTSVAQSQAAKQAQVTQMFAVGLLTSDQALSLMELGGPEKVLDYVATSKKKAQRENIRMKLLTDQAIQQHDSMFMLATTVGDTPQLDPNTGQYLGDPAISSPTALANVPIVGGNPSSPQPGPVIPVDDFDEHQVHIQVHNAFRMSQEYEILSTDVKEQFKLHVQMHQNALTQGGLQQFLQSIPSDGTDGGSPAPGGAPAAPSGGGMGAGTTIGTSGAPQYLGERQREQLANGGMQPPTP